MFDKKNFVLNCDLCDARKIKEEDLQSYEKIIINADYMLVDERSKSVLNSLPVVLNVDETLETSEEIRLISQNGNYELTGSTPVAPNTLLCVNGCLTIAPGTEEVLKNIFKIHVNGLVTCPKSLASSLSCLSVNGDVRTYPDGCILLEDSFVIDRYFPLRARENGQYYAADRVLLTDVSVKADVLAAKNVHFATGTFVVAEELLENSISMFDENVKLEVIPEGYSFVNGDCELTEGFLKKNGSRLYVSGSLTLNENSTPLLSKIEALCVSGNVYLHEEQKAAFLQIDPEYREICIISKARVIENKPLATLDNKILEASPDGILFRNCAALKIKDNLPADQLLEKVSIENCASVHCSPEQKSIVELISRNVAFISDGEEEGGSVKDMLGDLLHSRIVNADQYIL